MPRIYRCYTNTPRQNPHPRSGTRISVRLRNSDVRFTGTKILYKPDHCKKIWNTHKRTTHNSAIGRRTHQVNSWYRSLRNRIGDLEIEFTASILEDLYCEVLLGHDFLVQNEVFWDYAACTIHLGARRRTTACWKGHTTTPTNTAPDLS
jgi:hypothetical protein